MTDPYHLVEKRATCPYCEETVTYKDLRGIRRFKPKAKKCPSCDEVWR